MFSLIDCFIQEADLKVFIYFFVNQINVFKGICPQLSNCLILILKEEGINAFDVFVSFVV